MPCATRFVVCNALRALGAVCNALRPFSAVCNALPLAWVLGCAVVEMSMMRVTMRITMIIVIINHHRRDTRDEEC